MSDFMSETNALHLLHNVVKNYEKDVLHFYTAAANGGGGQNASKFVGRFDFKPFSKKMFDPIDPKILEHLYVEMLEECQGYMHSHQKSHVGANAFPHSFVSVPELVMNMILAYQLPHQKFVPNKESTEDKDEEKKEESKTEENGNGGGGGNRKKRRNSQAAKKGKNVTVGPKVTLSAELSAKLLGEMLKIPLAPETKLWKTAKYILCPSNCPKQLEVFGGIIAQNTRVGLISFAALSYFMHDQVLNRHLEDPITILHALYIGPLNAQTVEVFAANRNDEFRQKCREVLRTAIHATKDPMTFSLNFPEFIDKQHPDRVGYRDFVQNVNQLIRDLNGEHQGSQGIHTGWACAAIKKFGQKRYVDKTWKDENYYDLIWTVLAQRPHLKKFVVDVLEKNFKDPNAARFWRRMQPYQMNPTLIHNANVIKEDPLKPTAEFLNFPPKMRNIYMVSNDKEMKDLHMLLEYKVHRETIVYVGVDAEWSAYVNPSKATILQMALSDCIYIIDLESNNISPECYNLVLSYLFWTPEIIKIGFQFAEDLHQLRAAFRNCAVLYKPNQVICVGKLIMDMMDEIGKLDNSEEFKRDYLPFLTLEDTILSTGGGGGGKGDTSIDESISNESIDDSPGTSSSEPKESQKKEDSVKQQFLNKGLSFLCEKLLGRPLDKTEQCSVWDRRPLRNLQLRYAAMDAYCMLLLYEKCDEVFKRMGRKTEDYLKKQPPIRISLPLLSEAKL
ncbi:hypothetical protein CAEBREN_01896 [Caenorhabditis brenneri]|uniref:3'-5' exonuclease domain-containing protein n=1 Tax=Caenorhabditis brenneri TaxID=135651 RepID=G0MUP9_CAEBE|nr:hypothetical protein CAEBREN_01896 [Caenorhabditis brenneri]